MFRRFAKRHPFLAGMAGLCVVAVGVTAALERQNIVGMRFGLSECWWLSQTCVADWTAWAAVGTFGAVAVALMIPLWTIWLRNRARRRIAESVLKVAVASANDQLLNLTLAAEVLDAPAVHGALFRHAVVFVSMIDETPFAEAVPYFDALPEPIAEALTEAHVTVKRQRRTLALTKHGHPAVDRTEEAQFFRMNVLMLKKVLTTLRARGLQHFEQPEHPFPDEMIKDLVARTRRQADAEAEAPQLS